MDRDDGPVHGGAAHGADLVHRSGNGRGDLHHRRQPAIDPEPRAGLGEGREALLGEGRLPQVDALEPLEGGDRRHRVIPHLAAVEVQDLELLHRGQVRQARRGHRGAGEVEAAELPELRQARQARVGDGRAREVEPHEARLQARHRGEGVVPGRRAQQGEVGIEGVQVAGHGEDDRPGGPHALEGLGARRLLLRGQARQHQPLLGLVLGHDGLPARPLLDPRAQGAEGLLREPGPTLGHQVRVVLGQLTHLEQERAIRVAGDDGDEALVPLEQPGLQVEPHPALLLLGAVALEAVLGQDRVDVLRVGDVVDCGGQGEQRGGDEDHGRDCSPRASRSPERDRQGAHRPERHQDRAAGRPHPGSVRGRSGELW